MGKKNTNFEQYWSVREKILMFLQYSAGKGALQISFDFHKPYGEVLEFIQACDPEFTKTGYSFKKLLNITGNARGIHSICFLCNRYTPEDRLIASIYGPPIVCSTPGTRTSNRCSLKRFENRIARKFEARKKTRSSALYRIRRAMTNYIRNSLTSGKRNNHWENLVGYSLEDLKRHLEKRFKKGMNFENYGRHGWHIDHKIPVSAFNFNGYNDPDFKRCWALKNLQPMWAKDNIAKSNKLEKPFQPSLALSIENLGVTYNGEKR